MSLYCSVSTAKKPDLKRLTSVTSVRSRMTSVGEDDQASDKDEDEEEEKEELPDIPISRVFAMNAPEAWFIVGELFHIKFLYSYFKSVRSFTLANFGKILFANKCKNTQSMK